MEPLEDPRISRAAMTVTPEEDLLWRYSFKIDIEQMSKKLENLEQQVGALDARLEVLGSRLTNSEAQSSTRHDELAGEITENRKEAQEMAELLGSWKGTFESGLETQKKKLKKITALMSKHETRNGEFDVALAQVQRTIGSQDPDNAMEEERPLVSMPLSQRPGPSWHNHHQVLQDQQHQAFISIKLEPQGSKSFEEYLKYGQDTVPVIFDENVRFLEVEHVKAFVKNLATIEMQDSLSRTMEVKGWTWEMFQTEAMKIVSSR